MRSTGDAVAEIGTLHLLGGPYIVMGEGRMAVPEGSKRLVAYVALNGGRADRRQAASILWPHVDGHRAAGNLRSAAWRLRCAGLPILVADKNNLSLMKSVRVDLDSILSWACRVAEGKPDTADLDMRPGILQALDLLPGWYDDWVLQERDRLRQALLHAMDALVRLLVNANRCGEAVEVAMTAVSVEPLRESAQQVLIEAHLAEGNRCEAWRSFMSYKTLCERELGIRPSVELWKLVRFEASDRGFKSRRAALIAERSVPQLRSEGAR
jgi:DNA-binding SARP family transcriptional activator